ncbi:hypothetical protein H9X78_16310, partial [Clostridium saudiense]|nr:hypothetical protein [Clostridium saudiense]
LSEEEVLRKIEEDIKAKREDLLNASKEVEVFQNEIDLLQEVINNFKVAIENKDGRLLSKNLKVDGKKVDSESLLPLIEYYEEKSNTLLDITKKLRSENRSGMLNLESEKNIFGEEYYLNISRISVEVKSNFNDTEIFINNKT